MPVQPPTTSQPIAFEDALRELDEVVAALEAGQVSLEDSLALLERGMALAQQCDQTLAGAEATLEQLVATSSGELELQRLAWGEDDDGDDDGDDEASDDDD